MEQVFGLVFYKMIFEASMDAILITKPNGEIFRANQAACRILRMKEKEIITGGRTAIADLNDPRFHKALAFREKYGYVKAELNYKRKNGEILPVAVTSRVFKDEFGEPWTVIIFRDITAIKKAQKVLLDKKSESDKLAYHDYLTGLYNRRGFMKRLYQSNRNYHLKKQNFCIIMIDIDYLKKINDLYGHLRGDTILKKFAQLLMKTTMRPGYVGRIGGDEFAICLPNYSFEDAFEFAKILQQKTNTIRWKNIKNSPRLSASFGVLSAQDYQHKSLNELLSRADEFLYIAKNKRDEVYG